MILTAQKTNFKIKVVIFTHTNKQLSEKIKYITFKNIQHFTKYKRKFYSMLKLNGWNHHENSNNMMIKEGRKMTPFFILN